MVSDTVNTIKNAESQAEEKLKLTRKEAEQIISKAKAEAENIKEKAAEVARKEADATREKNKAKLQTIVSTNEKTFKEGVAAIKSIAKVKAPEAVDLVISKLIS
jgi:ATP synthase B/B'' CF(0).